MLFGVTVNVRLLGTTSLTECQDIWWEFIVWHDGQCEIVRCNFVDRMSGCLIGIWCLMWQSMWDCGYNFIDRISGYLMRRCWWMWLSMWYFKIQLHWQNVGYFIRICCLVVWHDCQCYIGRCNFIDRISGNVMRMRCNFDVSGIGMRRTAPELAVTALIVDTAEIWRDMVVERFCRPTVFAGPGTTLRRNTSNVCSVDILWMFVFCE